MPPENLLQVQDARIKYALKNTESWFNDPVDLIRKALLEKPETSVSWSGGKDSTIVLHMALQIKPDIVVNFNDTGVEFDETYEFIEAITEAWDLNLVTLKPKTTFWKIVDEYGFPMIRGKMIKKKKRGQDGRPMCCTLLKEEPLKRAKLASTLTGITVAESRMRTFGIAQRGQYYYAKTLKRWNWHPIAFWTYDQVWDYHREHDIPHNKIYDMGHHRCGCWPCTGYISWQEALKTSHPKRYRGLMKLTSRG